MWLLRLTMRVPRPLARAAKRLNCGAASTSMRAHLQLVDVGAVVVLGIGDADSSTLWTSFAPFFGMNFSVASALPDGLAAHDVGDQPAFLRARCARSAVVP